MKRLYLLRHAKSSWEDPALADHDRPLNARGRRAAGRMATYLREQGIRPELVLCSSARRTKETLEQLGGAVTTDSTVEIRPALYLADADDLLGIVRSIPEPLESALLIGHNPGMQDLAIELAGRGGERRRLREKFPTAALAALESKVDRWSELALGAAELVGYVRPKELR